MKNRLILGTILMVAGAICLNGCKKAQPAPEQKPASDSIHNRLSSAVIYEVNIRQATPEGTFRAFTDQHIDRLKKLGVDILWLMPVYPISVKNRKGSLGSYYSVADYKAVNPEFGTLDDLKYLISRAHADGMLVIMDWVANHTGWDNAWIKEHPDWYTHDQKGRIIPPVPDWSDVADLNYDNPGLAKAMTEALKYWVKEVGIDGYRCDAAAMAPTPFWHNALLSLDSIRPVIKLAEAWEPALMANGFDAAYGWDFHHLMNEIAKGSKNLGAISTYIAKTDTLYAPDDMLLNFITNHDENSWSGTEFERMGPYVKNFAVMTYLMPGIPLIYTGQEAAMKKRLRFFDKDTVNWSDTLMVDFYRKLNALKHRNPALWAGINAGKIQFSADTVNHVATLVRTSGDNCVIGFFNFGTRAANLKVPFPEINGIFRDVFTDNLVKIKKDKEIAVDPDYFVLLEKEK